MSGLILNPRGVVPRAHDCNLGPEYAKVAENVRLRGGRWDPWNTPVELVQAPVGSCRAHVRDCCWHVSTDPGACYVDAKACRETYLSRDCEYPLVTRDFCDDAWHNLGFPIPNTPDAFLDLDDSDVCGPNTHTRNYVITYGDGCDEGAPSVPVCLASAGKDTPAIFTLPDPPDECWGVTQVHIYRRATEWDSSKGLGLDESGLLEGLGGTDAESHYFHLITLPIDTRYYIDDMGTKLGRLLVSVDFFPPAQGLIIFGETASGSLVGFVGNEVWWSEKNAYHAWPVKSRMNLPYDVVSGQVCNDTVFLLTRANAYVMQDTEECRDATCRQTNQIKTPYACLSRKSSVALEGGVLYSSEEGLVLLTQDGLTRIVSHRAFDSDDWTALGPSELQLEIYQKHLVLSTDRLTYIWDLSLDELGLSEDLSSLSIVPDDWIVDEQGRLYFLHNDRVYEFDAGTDNMEMHWQQVTQTLDRDMAVTAVRVQYTNKDTQNHNNVSLYRDDRVIMSRDVAEFARLRGSRGRCYSISIRGPEPMCGLFYGSSIASLGIS